MVLTLHFTLNQILLHNKKKFTKHTTLAYFSSNAVLVEVVGSFFVVAADEGGVLVHGAEALGAFHARRDPASGGRELEPATGVRAAVMHIMVILK